MKFRINAKSRITMKSYHAMQWILIDYVNVVVPVMRKKRENFTNWKKCGATPHLKEYND